MPVNTCEASVGFRRLHQASATWRLFGFYLCGHTHTTTTARAALRSSKHSQTYVRSKQCVCKEISQNNSMQYCQWLNIVLQDFAACHKFMKNTRKHDWLCSMRNTICCQFLDVSNIFTRTDQNIEGKYQWSTIYWELMDSRCASQPVSNLQIYNAPLELCVHTSKLRF